MGDAEVHEAPGNLHTASAVSSDLPRTTFSIRGGGPIHLGLRQNCDP